MKHIDEETLELFILESPEVAERRGEIGTHLASCAGCAALHDEIAQYYADVRAEQDEQKRATSQALTVRSLAVKVPTYTEFGPLSQIQKTWPARIVLFVIRHPLASAVGTLGTIGLFSLALLTLAPKDLFKDTNPAYARAKEEFLVVYNKEGDVLWKKHVGVGYDGEKLLTTGRGWSPEEYLAAVDVDRDGRNEVVTIQGFLPNWADRNAVFCYNTDGSQRWRYNVSRKMTFGNESFADSWHTDEMVILNMREIDKMTIAVTLNHGGDYYPQLLIRLDPSTGSLIGEYWHPGKITAMSVFDADDDGVDELVCAGEHNGYDLASLAILDSRNFSGHTPAPPAYTPAGIPHGNEKYYLLFPRTDLKSVATQKRARTRSVRKLAGVVDAHVHEEVGFQEPFVVYHFNNAMECLSADGSDPFVTLHRKLEREGKLTRGLDTAYWEELKQGVQYWDGEKFVSEPTMNKRYVEAMKEMAKK